MLSSEGSCVHPGLLSAGSGCLHALVLLRITCRHCAYRWRVVNCELLSKSIHNVDLEVQKAYTERCMWDEPYMILRTSPVKGSREARVQLKLLSSWCGPLTSAETSEKWSQSGDKSKHSEQAAAPPVLNPSSITLCCAQAYQ